MINDFIRLISDPNLVYLLLTIGALAVVTEIVHPGGIVPGVIGVAALGLAFVGLASLPFSWGSLVLLLIAVVLLVFELTTTFSGILSVIAFAMFLVGSFTLYGSGVAVSPWLIGFMAACAGGFGVYAFRAIQTAQKAPITVGTEALRQATAQAITRLNPRGQVRLNGEVWTAILQDTTMPVEAGQSVEITDVEGTILKVRGLENSQVQEWSKPGW